MIQHCREAIEPHNPALVTPTPPRYLLPLTAQETENETKEIASYDFSSHKETQAPAQFHRRNPGHCRYYHTSCSLPSLSNRARTLSYPSTTHSTRSLHRKNHNTIPLPSPKSKNRPKFQQCCTQSFSKKAPTSQYNHNLRGTIQTCSSIKDSSNCAWPPPSPICNHHHATCSLKHKPGGTCGTYNTYLLSYPSCPLPLNP